MQGFYSKIALELTKKSSSFDDHFPLLNIQKQNPFIFDK